MYVCMCAWESMFPTGDRMSCFTNSATSAIS